MIVRRLMLVACLTVLAGPLAAAEPLRVAPFAADVTPPIGSPVAYAPARSIVDPLSARGVVLVGAGRPIVLCAVDWIGIGNEGHDVWREKLAAAAGTTADRVAVHTLHQHDAPRCDFSVSDLLAAKGLTGQRYDDAFAREAIQRTAAAIAKAVAAARPVTHIGIGIGEVEKVASNRRVLGPDGKVKIVRYSATRNPEAIAAPEGLIDPQLRSLSFWNGDEAIAVLTYYACHPQSYYGKGDVTCDFVGLARNARENATKIPHIHFNGAGGNVTAGKYNDGSPEMRPVLAERLAVGMAKAWNATAKSPVTASDIEWRIEEVALPPGKHLEAGALQATLDDTNAEAGERIAAASKLTFLNRLNAGHQTAIPALRIGDAVLLHLPGELFVEYQLAAQAMAPDRQIFFAAYGDYAAGYIGTAIAYEQGGYETSERASNVAPSVEPVLMGAIERLLGP